MQTLGHRYGEMADSAQIQVYTDFIEVFLSKKPVAGLGLSFPLVHILSSVMLGKRKCYDNDYNHEGEEKDDGDGGDDDNDDDDD